MKFFFFFFSFVKISSGRARARREEEQKSNDAVRQNSKNFLFFFCFLSSFFPAPLSLFHGLRPARTPPRRRLRRRAVDACPPHGAASALEGSAASGIDHSSDAQGGEANLLLAPSCVEGSGARGAGARGALDSLRRR